MSVKTLNRASPWASDTPAPGNGLKKEFGCVNRAEHSLTGTKNVLAFVPSAKIAAAMIAVLSGHVEKANKSKALERKRQKANLTARKGHLSGGSAVVEARLESAPCDSNACSEEPHTNFAADIESAEAKTLFLTADINSHKWHRLAMKLHHQSSSFLFLGSLQNLPNFIGSAFDTAEAQMGVKFTPEYRKVCYHEFCKKSSSLGTLQSSDIEEMLCSHQRLGIDLPLLETRRLINDKLGSANWAEMNVQSVSGHCDQYGFDVFVSILAAARQLSDAQARMRGWSAKAILGTALPIDPDSTAKQAWDVFMLLLLLYCSFSVPYEIAFLDSGLPALDLFEIMVHDRAVAAAAAFPTRCTASARRGTPPSDRAVRRVKRAVRGPARLAKVS